MLYALEVDTKLSLPCASREGPNDGTVTRKGSAIENIHTHHILPHHDHLIQHIRFFNIYHAIFFYTSCNKALGRLRPSRFYMSFSSFPA
ncbi:uncharacterized protein FOMMEDRAFT_143059 [Fomitiporia mediterranea MF3/22]|uniref:uncharacterized protein n=1 Tax=Fomitiporia mediterranea (strain MF3/22) TaxID=694068 RepID=UPI0004407EC7|nr:uncharacterized protein FOMMEDRAFT_143059 [Fomitiporia mediterranea MF3/22]EJC98611.1 hypothetical protein FOMMEDRAFT_143059 [Fomitiporia mediterranea MF3/22]